MKTSKAGLDLIKKWEGCRLKAYRDSAGVLTIGYGLTSAAGIIPVTEGLTITQAQADDYLARALVKYEAAVEKAITRPMTQPQFDAMTSLCYNIGPGEFPGSSVARRFNEGNISGAADAFLMWTKAGGKELQGLVKRRHDERKLFLSAGKPVEAAPQPQAPIPPPAPETPPAASPVPPAASHNAMAWLVGMILAVLAFVAAFLTKEIGP